MIFKTQKKNILINRNVLNANIYAFKMIKEIKYFKNI